jgi:hypothetical protein
MATDGKLAATVVTWLRRETAQFVGLGVRVRGGTSLLLAELRGEAPIDYHAGTMAIRVHAWNADDDGTSVDVSWPAAVEARLVERADGVAVLLANLHREAARLLNHTDGVATHALGALTSACELSVVDKPFLPGASIAVAQRWSAWPSQVAHGHWLFEPRLVDDGAALITAIRADGVAFVFRAEADDARALPIAALADASAATALPLARGWLLLHLEGPHESTVFADHPRYGGTPSPPPRTLAAAIVNADAVAHGPWGDSASAETRAGLAVIPPLVPAAVPKTVVLEKVQAFACARHADGWRIVVAHAEPPRVALYRLVEASAGAQVHLEPIADWATDVGAFDVAVAASDEVTVVATAHQRQLRVIVEAWVVRDAATTPAEERA